MPHALETTFCCDVVLNPTDDDGQRVEMSLRQLVQEATKEEIRRAFAEHTEAVAQMLAEEFKKLGAARLDEPTPSPAVFAADSERHGKDETSDAGHEAVIGHEASHFLYEMAEEDKKSFAELASARAPLCRSFFYCLQFFYDNMGVHQAKHLGDPISKFVESNLFGALINGLIFLNCIFMWLGADEEIGQPDQMSDFMKYGEYFFMFAYSLEFVLKLVRYRWEYFIGPEWKYNWLDVFLLALSYLFEISGASLGFLRSIRILKLAKALRVFRLVATFKSLRAILVSLINTIGTLGWSILMLTVIHFLFGLVIVLRIAQWLMSMKDDGQTVDPEEYDLLMEWFGSVFTSMLSLYGTSSGGEGWQTLFDVLEPVGWIEQAFMLFFVFFSQIAILNIILGIFVDDAMKSMQSSKEEAIFEHRQAQIEIAENIESLCREADTAGTGRISQEEFLAAARKGSFQAYVDLHGLQAHNLSHLFGLMSKSSEDGQVDIHEFVKGCMSMSGPASAYDMHVVRGRVNGLYEQSHNGNGPRDLKTSL